MTTGTVKPSAESRVQISSDRRRWCHALWRQLRLLSTLSRLPAAPAGSESPPSPSVHLVSSFLLSSESVEILMWKKKKLFDTSAPFCVVYKLSSLWGRRALQASLGFTWLPLALMRAWVDVFSAVGHYITFRLQPSGHLPGRLWVINGWANEKWCQDLSRSRLVHRICCWRSCKVGNSTPKNHWLYIKSSARHLSISDPSRSLEDSFAVSAILSH